MTDKVCWPGTTTVGLLLLTGWLGRAEISTEGGLTRDLSAVVWCTDLCVQYQDHWAAGDLALRVRGRWRLVTRVWGGEYLLHCDDNEDLSLDHGGGEESLWHQNLQWKENVFICNQLLFCIDRNLKVEIQITNIQKYFEFWNRIFHFYLQPLLWIYCSPGSWSIMIISTGMRQAIFRILFVT